MNNMVQALKQSKKTLALLVATLVLILAVACGTNSSEDGTPANIADILSAVGGPEAAQLLRFGSGANTGIWVNGTGQATGDPDLGIISLGVEALADSAAEARGLVAEAIDRTISSLRGNNVDDRDVQTSQFSIRPRYDNQEVTRCIGCRVKFDQVLIGYQVNNTLTVKVRDLDNMGGIIDGATEAAGNLVRINRVSFTIEDTKPLQYEAREEAIADMVTKANTMAELAGVELGELVSLTESDGGVPQSFSRIESVGDFAFASEQPTSILAGELDVNVNVQGVFVIAH
ncbi:MAG: hypothetical protein BZY77_01250 [SAR202 cluster bacterium Io17-Chloro-G5]|nr:MAG: hypothetical protein BZY77_01250 [SAR202 cluster bacterium Io17-Chloro-G5]